MSNRGVEKNEKKRFDNSYYIIYNYRIYVYIWVTFSAFKCKL